MSTTIRKPDFKKLLIAFAEVMESAGDFLVEYGKTEEKNPEYVKVVSELKKNPDKLNVILEQVPKEYTTKVFGVFMKLSLLAQKYQQIQKMDSKEKIEIGKQVKKIAIELKELENDSSDR